MHTIWVVFGNQSLRPMLLDTIQRAWDDRQAQYDKPTPFPKNRVKMSHIKDIINHEGTKYSSRLGMKSNDFEYDRASHKILEFLDSRRIPTMATCDAMFLDEAQDFGPNTLRFLSRLVRQWDPEDTNSKPMMIFYDNAQNVYDQQPPSWTELGLDMRGRSAIMKESFRSTKPISEFAINVLNQLSPFNKKHPLDSLRDDPDFKELEKLGLISEGQRLGDAWWRVHFNQIDGPYPTVHLFDRIQDEMEAISEQLSTWIRDEAVKPQQIKLLYMSDYTKNSIERFIKPNMKNIGVNLVIQKSESYTQDETALIATTPHSFKGYDAEIVVLVSVHNYATTSGHYFTPALYVAMTRARSILSIYGRRRKKNDNAATIRLFEKLEQCASQQLVNDDNLVLLKQLEGTKIDHTGNTK
jgi:superfamily I DNA/RNA helicase